MTEATDPRIIRRGHYQRSSGDEQVRCGATGYGRKIGGSQVPRDAFPPGSVDFFYLAASTAGIFGIPEGGVPRRRQFPNGRWRGRAGNWGCRTMSLDWVAWRGSGPATDAQLVSEGEWVRVTSRRRAAFTAWEFVDGYDVARKRSCAMPARRARWSGASACNRRRRNWSVRCDPVEQGGTPSLQPGCGCLRRAGTGPTVHHSLMAMTFGARPSSLSSVASAAMLFNRNGQITRQLPCQTCRTMCHEQPDFRVSRRPEVVLDGPIRSRIESAPPEPRGRCDANGFQPVSGMTATP